MIDFTRFNEEASMLSIFIIFYFVWVMLWFEIKLKDTENITIIRF